MAPTRRVATRSSARRATANARANTANSNARANTANSNARNNASNARANTSNARRNNVENDTNPDMAQMIAQQIAAMMPELIAQLREGTAQGTGGGSGSGNPEPVVNNEGPEPVVNNEGPEVVITGSGRAEGSTQRAGCTLKTFMSCKAPEYRGNEGATGTLQWMEKMESIFDAIDCADKDRVRFAAFVFQGTALTWWNSIVNVRGRAEISKMTWEQLKELMIIEYVPESEIQKLEDELWNLTMVGSDIQGYTSRFHALSQLVPHLVRPELKRIGRYTHGLPPAIRKSVLSSKPSTFQSAVEIAITLTQNAVRDGELPPMIVKLNSEGKRGGEDRYGDSQKRPRRQDTPQDVQAYAVVAPNVRGGPPQCDQCGSHHARELACWKCDKCKKLGHTGRYCKTMKGKCYECGSPEHLKANCPELAPAGTYTPPI